MIEVEGLPESFPELTDVDRGRWVVLTEASAYCVDLEERRIRRRPGLGVGALSDAVVVVLEFDTDGEWLHLVRLEVCHLGQRLRALVRTPGGAEGPIRSTWVAGIYDAAEFFARMPVSGWSSASSPDIDDSSSV